MEIKKLLKRYLKECGVYGSPMKKNIIEFVDTFKCIYEPFNAFRWDTTSEGHNYWYDKALKWVIYMYDNIDSIDGDRDIILIRIKSALYALTRYYKLTDAKVESYDKALRLHDDIILRS